MAARSDEEFGGVSIVAAVVLHLPGRKNPARRFGPLAAISAGVAIAEIYVRLSPLPGGPNARTRG